MSGMTYAVMRGVRGGGEGFVRAEMTAEGTRVTLRAEGVPAEAALRLLLVSSGEDGAVLDLGRVTSTPMGAACGEWVVPAVEMRLWDAFVLAEDWPSGRLAAAAWLTASAGPLWRLAEAVRWYLSVPVS